MIKKLLIATTAATLSVATVGYAASSPTVFPHGISSTAPVVTPQGVTQGTIGDTVTQAQGAVQHSEVGAAGGVAGLDNSMALMGGGIKVGTVAAKKYPNTTNNGTQMPGHVLWFGNQSILGEYADASKPDGVTDVGDWWTSPPEVVHIGGQSEGSSGFLNIHCSPYAASNAGTCLQAMMGLQNIQGLAAGIGPGASDIPTYDNFDAVNFTEQVGGSMPLFVLTSDKASNVFPPVSDGLDHTPTFTTSGATFANPLPAEISKWFINHQQGIRLMTNEIGCQTCAIKTYAGIVKGVTTNADGLVTGVTVSGWRIFSSGDADSNQIPGQTVTDGSKTYATIAAASSGDTTLTVSPTVNLYKSMPISGSGIPEGTTISSVSYSNSGTTITLSNALSSATPTGTPLTITTVPAIDTEWSNFKYPAIMVGVYTKAFQQYSLCSLDAPSPDAGRGDINYPSGGASNQLRTCEGWEMDLWNNDPVDHRPVLHGLTVAYSKRSKGGIPSYDSYDVWAAGANSISYKQSGEYWTLPFSGSNMKVSSYDGTPYAAGSTKNIVQWSQSERAGYTADGGYPRNNIMSGLWTTRNVAAGCSTTDNVICDDPNGSSKDVTVHLGIQIDWYGASNKGLNGDPIWNSPVQEQIEFNPASNHKGINLCAGSQNDSNCILQVSAGKVLVVGSLKTSGDFNISGGIYSSGADKLLTVYTGSPDGNNTAIEVRYDLSSNTLMFTNNHYGNAYKFVGSVNADRFKETLSTPASSTSACTAGQFTDDVNYHYVCVATNQWKRVALESW